MRVRRGLLPLVLTLCFIATSCGEAPSINLQNAPLPIPPGSNQKPTLPGTDDSSDDGNTTPGSTGPGSTPRPTATPIPAPSEPDRLACTASTTGTFITFSSMVGADGFGREISLVEAEENGPSADEITREDANMINLRSPLIARALDIDRIQVLTIATRSDRRGQAAPKFYSTIANITYRTGLMIPIGSVVSMDENAVALANKANLNLRSHGVSLQGHYLLVPSTQGTLKVLDVETLNKVGELAIDPRTSFFPQLDEASGTVAILRYQSGALVPAFYQVSLKGGRVASTGDVFTASSSRGMIASPPVLAGDAWVWGEQESGRVSQVTIGSFASNALKLNSGKAGLARADFVPADAGVRVFPQVAPVLKDGRVVVAVAYERLANATSGRLPFKVEVAKVALVAVSANKSSLVGTVDYPLEVTTHLSKQGLEQRPFAAAALLNASDLKTAYISLPTMFGFRAFRLKDTGLEAVSKETCFQLSVQQAK